MIYYLWISGKEHGPYTLAQLEEAVADGTINPQQTARTENDADWKPLEQLITIKRLPPPPKPPDKPRQSTIPPRLPEPPPIAVIVTDFDMEIGTMFMFMIKWAIASIPAFVILGLIGGLLWVLFAAFVGLFR